MKADNLKNIVFGDDLEKKLNEVRQKMNDEIREKTLKNNKKKETVYV